MSSFRHYAAFGRSAEVAFPALELSSFSELNGFEAEDLCSAALAFRTGALAFLNGIEATRPGQVLAAGFAQLYEKASILAAQISETDAREFFGSNFTPYRIRIGENPDRSGNGFLTGYYEPEVEGTLTATPGFIAPVLARPKDLITFPLGIAQIPDEPELSAGRLSDTGQMVSYWDRAQIETGLGGSGSKPIVWLRDAIEVFLVQVQGSARVRLPDGRCIRLGYAGRNGHPTPRLAAS